MTNVPRGDLPPTWKTFPAKFYAPSIISPINSLEYRSTEFLLYPLNIQIIEYFNSMLFLLFVSRVENFLKISGILSFLGRGKDFFPCIFRGKMAALLRFIAPFEEQRRVVSEEEALHRPGEKKRASLFFFLHIAGGGQSTVKGRLLPRVYTSFRATPACQRGAYLRGESCRLIFHVRQWLPVSAMGMDRAYKRCQTKQEIPSCLASLSLSLSSCQ